MTTVTVDIPKLHAGQDRVAREASRFNVLECGRRFGKTTLGENLIIDTVLRGYPGGWFAPTYKTMLEQWKNLSRILKPVVTGSNKIEQQMAFVTGGILDFWSLDNVDSGRGRKYKRVIIDEASIIRDLEQAWNATIRPTLTDYRGDAWFLGTPKGRNFFHRLFSRGEHGKLNWKSWRLPTVANPFMDPSEVEEARQELPQHVFEQEYLGIPADDGGNPFGLQAIAACVVLMSDGEPVVFGVDLAKSQDWTVVCGLDAQGRVCLLERWQGQWGETRRRILSLVNGWPTLIDSTGVGDPIVEDLQRARSNIEGFKFTSQSKQQLMEGLAGSIQQGTIGFPDGWLRVELENFEYEYTRTGVRYTAPSGLHDDGVCALALANRHLRVRLNAPLDAFVVGQDCQEESASNVFDNEAIWDTV